MSQFDTESTAGDLIAASKVNGTNVFGSDGEKIGSVRDPLAGDDVVKPGVTAPPIQR